MRVGVIGLGAMGSAFADNLIKAGHHVTGWDRDFGQVEPLQRSGGAVADTPAAAFDTDITLSMLADDSAYRSVFLDSGLVNQLPIGATHVVMATVSVAFAQEFSAAHRERGIDYVAAPVLGNSVLARAGKVHILAAGDAAAIERVKPALTVLGQSFRNLGSEPQQANVAKIATNLMLGSAVETLSEAIVLAQSYGLLPETLVELFTNTIFSAPAYESYGRAMVARSFDPPAFRLRHGGKDINLAKQAAEAKGVPLPIADVVRAAVQEAEANGDGDRDFAALITVSERRVAGR